jgi:hypothetical protein
MWEWGRLNSLSFGEPQQVGIETNWIAVSVSASHSLALKNDGTLWAWSDYRVHQLEPREFASAQVGTNSNWRAIACYPSISYGIRSDGTLWGWGSPPVSNPSLRLEFRSPIQFSNDTNWSDFVNGFLPMFRTQSGEIWEGVFAALPSSNSPISASCRMLATNFLPDAIAIAASDTARIFELHADGTLWQRPFPGMPGSPNSNKNQKWTRVGKRSDWTRLWSSGGTAFGLTKDGTIWTWGFDPTRPPQQSISSYLQNMQASVQDRLGKTTTAPGKSGRPRHYQKEPRPLLRVVPD